MNIAWAWHARTAKDAGGSTVRAVMSMLGLTDVTFMSGASVPVDVFVSSVVISVLASATTCSKRTRRVWLHLHDGGAARAGDLGGGQPHSRAFSQRATEVQRQADLLVMWFKIVGA